MIHAKKILPEYFDQSRKGFCECINESSHN